VSTDNTLPGIEGIESPESVRVQLFINNQAVHSPLVDAVARVVEEWMTTEEGAALSVLGRAANSAGQRADIVAGANDTALMRQANALAFGKVPNAVLADVGEATFKMRASGSGTGSPIDGTGTQAKTAMGLATTTTDNAVIRADGAGGNTQTSLLIVDDSGNVSSFGGQIAFPATQNPSSNANTLDDYEEGTWTPGLTFGGGTTGLTYTGRSGGYIVIGALVHVWGNIVINAKGSSTGQARLTGLPFTIGNSLGTRGAGSVGFFGPATTLPLGVQIGWDGGSNFFFLRGYTASGTSDVTDANFNNGTEIQFAAVYPRI
jgi:hypothetical protein